MAFVHHFEKAHPTDKRTQPGSLPPLEGGIASAQRTAARMGEVAVLPERNRIMIYSMIQVMMESCNNTVGSFEAEYPQFWGLYLVGSRASGTNKWYSDVDLLSVGTFYYGQGFDRHYTDAGEIFDGFEVDQPDELPSEYNMGSIDRKYLRRATPSAVGDLAVDLNVVDLTMVRGVTLDSFKTNMDVGEDGEPLARLPIAELTVAVTPRPSLRF